MANIYLAVNQESVTAGFFNVDEVTEGTSSSSSSDFELRIANPSTSGQVHKQDIIDAIELIKAYILDGRIATLPGEPF